MILRLLLLLSISTITLAATPSRYQVEVIIFKRADFAQTDLESWQWAHPNISENFRYISTDESAVPDLSFVKLRPNLFTLAKEQQLLTESSNIKPILHLAWQATADELNKSPPILLTAGNDYNVLPEFHGMISLRKKQFFMVKAHLTLTEPSIAFGDKLQPTPELVSYHSVQQYNAQVNELVYFDSPVIGMLLKITLV